MKKRLTDIQIQSIIRQYQSGLGSDTIAQNFDVHPNSVLKVLKRNGIERRPLSQFTVADIEQMKQLYTKGDSLAKIAKQFGVSDVAIFKIFKKEDFELRQPKNKPNSNNEVVDKDDDSDIKQKEDKQKYEKTIIFN